MARKGNTKMGICWISRLLRSIFCIMRNYKVKLMDSLSSMIGYTSHYCNQLSHGPNLVLEEVKISFLLSFFLSSSTKRLCNFCEEEFRQEEHFLSRCAAYTHIKGEVCYPLRLHNHSRDNEETD